MVFPATRFIENARRSRFSSRCDRVHTALTVHRTNISEAFVPRIRELAVKLAVVEMPSPRHPNQDALCFAQRRGGYEFQAPPHASPAARQQTARPPETGYYAVTLLSPTVTPDKSTCGCGGGARHMPAGTVVYALERGFDSQRDHVSNSSSTPAQC
ncbi:hypothetical protein K505DRAFT_416268 [Melanomma pulvis-pyrius CBS 109.77]|uniref:Uncharacterized protein n=1 Tax=Melanomma pulvis-pyrius CBS 109.77 TaxID=1314802 RepID=A0A6A6XHN0_9PLEO|nr:hypothetical protein K505DRAFT_416268 [Melanomma pulvis-pyrius CBS 109.77]